MNAPALETLGAIAGLAGIAIGMVALLVRPVIDQTHVLPLSQRTPLLRLIVVGAFAVGALGIFAWLAGSMGNHTTIVTGGPCSNTSAGSSSGNSVQCDVAPLNTGSTR